MRVDVDLTFIALVEASSDLLYCVACWKVPGLAQNLFTEIRASDQLANQRFSGRFLSSVPFNQELGLIVIRQQEALSALVDCGHRFSAR